MLYQTVASLALLGLSQAQGQADKDKVTPKPPFNSIPELGFGTWRLEQNNAAQAVSNAIQAGFRHFDGATSYTNQQWYGPGLKDGIQKAGIKREDIFVTSKIWANRHGANANSGVKINLEQLGLDYLDLVLMHFPVGTEGNKTVLDYVNTWKEMEKLVSPTGPVRRIGISNFNVTQLEELLSVAKIKPFTHQIELHPYLQQNDFVELHKKHNIKLTAYAPLGNTNPAYNRSDLNNAHLSRFSSVPPLLENPVIKEIAAARGCTPAQVPLVWNLRRGVGVIVKAADPAHMKEDYAAWSKCKLTAEDDAKIKAMETKWKPTRFWEMCSPTWKTACFTGQADP